MAKTVLVVEDNELNMKLFHDLLEANGYDTIQTRNGLEAIDLDLLRTLVPDEARRQSIITRHTTPAQAARVFSQVSPKLAVFSHSPGTAAIV